MALAQATPGADAASWFSLVGVLVVVLGGIVTTLIVHRRQRAETAAAVAAMSPPSAESRGDSETVTVLREIVEDLRKDVEAAQEREADERKRHEQQMLDLREFYAGEYRKLQARVNYLEGRRP